MKKQELINKITRELNTHMPLPTHNLLKEVLEYLEVENIDVEKEDRYIISFRYLEKDENGYGCLQYNGKVEGLDRLINSIKTSQKLQDVIILSIFKIQ